MRYIMGAKVRPERRADLLRSLGDGTFGEGFPYGDLGKVLSTGWVDATGTIRWVEVCYCREYYGVAMEEELPYLEEYLTDIVVADARSPRYCKATRSATAVPVAARCGSRVSRCWTTSDVPSPKRVMRRLRLWVVRPGGWGGEATSAPRRLGETGRT